MRALLLCLGLVAAVPVAAKPLDREPGAKPISVSVEPIERFGEAGIGDRVGGLIFRGGLVLSSEAPVFGGLSGLAIDPDGERFLAVSDAGLWVAGRFVETGGALAGIADVTAGPLLGTAGAPLRGRDVEAVTFDGQRAVVSTEGVTRLLAYPFGTEGMMARATILPIPETLKRVSGNAGIEALRRAPPASPVAGALVTVEERSGDGVIAGGPRPGSFTINRRDGYDITDIDFLPDGDLLVLERYFNGIGTIAFRIRRIAGGAVKPGATLDGEILIEADGTFPVDNMEALAVSRDESGATLLTLLSDDNFNWFQRTLALRFALP